MCSDWLNDIWPKVRQGCVDKDIFNAVLTDLLFMFSFIMISMYIFHLRKGKFLNERFTVIVCGNMTGIENETLTVTGKSRYSRCFKNVKMLPFNYQHSRKVWLTSEFFEAELRRWDEEQQNKTTNISQRLYS